MSPEEQAERDRIALACDILLCLTSLPELEQVDYRTPRERKPRNLDNDVPRKCRVCHMTQPAHKFHMYRPARSRTCIACLDAPRKRAAA